MNKTDFSHLGGFPLTQDELDYLQQAYIACVQALAAAPVNGTTPYTLTGCAVSGGGNTVANGWFVYGGELIQLTGGTVTPSGGQVALVLITDNTSNLTYNDASVFAAHHMKTATLIAAATATDATHFPLSALLTYPVSLGMAGRESAWTNYTASGIPIGTGGGASAAFNVNYKRNWLSNTVVVQGVATITTANDCYTIDANTFDNTFHLATGYHPSAEVPFAAQPSIIEWAISGGGNAYVPVLAAYVDTSGNLQFQFPKPTSGTTYTVTFSFEMPLD